MRRKASGSYSKSRKVPLPSATSRKKPGWFFADGSSQWKCRRVRGLRMPAGSRYPIDRAGCCAGDVLVNARDEMLCKCGARRTVVYRLLYDSSSVHCRRQAMLQHRSILSLQQVSQRNTCTRNGKELTLLRVQLVLAAAALPASRNSCKASQAFPLLMLSKLRCIPSLKSFATPATTKRAAEFISTK